MNKETNSSRNKKIYKLGRSIDTNMHPRDRNGSLDDYFFINSKGFLWKRQ